MDTDDAAEDETEGKFERVCSVCKATFLSEYSKEREGKVACPPCLIGALRKYGWIK